MSQITKAIASLILSLLFINPISASVVQKRRSRASAPSAPHRPIVRKDPARERRAKTFELVWQTVNEENFDPTFGGVNWTAVYSRYYPRVSRLATDQELYILLQQMLNEIPQSHFAIIPPESIPRIKAKRRLPVQADGKDDESVKDSLGDQEEEAESDNAVATQMMNGIGIDVRILNGQVVITRVAPDSPAAKASLRPGFVLKSVDFMPLGNIPPGVVISPGLHMRLRQRILVDYLGGEPGTDVHLLYLDEEDKEHQATIKRERLMGTLSRSLGNLPPLYTELESKRLKDKIGYVRFTVFTPQLAEKICGAIKSMRDAPGIIIDLRGNPGGVMGVASGVVGLLTNKTGLIGTLRMRSGSIPIPSFPQRSSYNGPIVVLIDRLSGSTAEVMAAALQESRRALVVGERSSGQVLGANIIKLPTGALFEYARAGFKTSLGATLEGKGVTPDVETKLDRSSLLKGEDDQLQEAIRQIELGKENAKSRTPDSVPPPPPPPPLPPPPAPVVVKIPAATASSGAESGKVEAASRHGSSLKSTPQADLVMERYIKAIGGREALERLKNRVSVGVCTYPYQGLSGKIVINEEAPDKRSMLIEIPNLGVTKVVFDGKRGWTQNSLMGFYEFKGPVLSALRREFDFYKITKYRELYSELIYKGAFDSSDGKVEVLEVVAEDGSRDELHFDAKTGLLLYGGGEKLGDYRQVGEVKVPFLQTMLVGGIEIKIQLEQVSHNVPISEDAFAEPHSCFTGQ
jgi:carboxyl-terminal processing protease